MALSLATQWTLVASGLIAHADAVMAGEECERLMGMLDEHVDGDDYGEWLAIVSDRDALEQRLAALPTLPEEHHRDVLEDAWVMAIADGRRVPEEEEMLSRIAEQLGVEAVQLDFWREAWTRAQDDAATAAASAMRYALAGDGPLESDDRSIVHAQIEAMPTVDEHREALRRGLSQPRSIDEVSRALTALQKSRRAAVLRVVAEAVRQSARRDDAAPRLIELAAGCGVSAIKVESWLSGG